LIKKNSDKTFFSYLNTNFYLIEQFLDEIIKHLSTDYTGVTAPHISNHLKIVMQSIILKVKT
jgi:dihydroneopterin aldolase